MKVTINSIDQNIITFHSEFETGVAMWHGESPKVKSVHHVEFDIKETLLLFFVIYYIQYIQLEMTKNKNEKLLEARSERHVIP